MSLILKQESTANAVLPPAGKTTVFVNTGDQLSTKAANGTVTTFPTRVQEATGSKQ